MKLTVFGAGMMGLGAIHDLLRQDDLETLYVVDAGPEHLMRVSDRFGDPRLRPLAVNLDDPGAEAALSRALADSDGLLSCVPYRYNLALTRLAIAHHCHFTDLGGNNDVVDAQFALDAEARQAGVAVVPDCGLAPGTVSILAGYGISLMDKAENVHMRVGGLPRNPCPPLNYKLVFSVNGLINEYIEPARAIRDGRIIELESLGELEALSFPPPFETLEAFVTSGGTSTLVKTFEFQVKNLDYKTIRYPGHCEAIRVLKFLGLTESRPVYVGGNPVSPRAVLEHCMAETLSEEGPDVILARVWVEGVREGKPTTVSFELVDHHDEATGLSAMARTTAFAETVVMLMLVRGQIPQRGVLYQELTVPGGAFIRDMAARGVNYRQS